MDTQLPETEIDRAARELGIVPGDPSYAFVMGMRRMMQEHREEVADQLSEIRSLVEKAKIPLDKSALRSVLGGLASDVVPSVIRGLMHRLTFGIALAAVVTAVLLFGAGYFTSLWQNPPVTRYIINHFVAIDDKLNQCHDDKELGRVCNIPIVVLPKGK